MSHYITLGSSRASSRVLPKWQNRLFELPTWTSYFSLVSLCFCVAGGLLCISFLMPLGHIIFLSYNTMIVFTFQPKHLDFAISEIPLQPNQPLISIDMHCPYEVGNGLDRFWFLSTRITHNITCPDFSDFGILKYTSIYYALAISFTFLCLLYNVWKLTPKGRKIELEYQYRCLGVSVILYSPTIVFTIILYVFINATHRLIANDPKILSIPFYLEIPNHYFPGTFGDCLNYSIPQLDYLMLALVFNCFGAFFAFVGNFLSFYHLGIEVGDGEPKSCPIWVANSFCIRPSFRYIAGTLLLLFSIALFIFMLFLYLSVRPHNPNFLDVDVNYMAVANKPQEYRTYKFYTDVLTVSTRNGTAHCFYNESGTGNNALSCPPTAKLFETYKTKEDVQIFVLTIGGLTIAWHLYRLCFSSVLVHNQYLGIFTSGALCLLMTTLCFIASNLSYEVPAFQILFPTLDCSHSSGCYIEDGFSTLYSTFSSQFYWRMMAYLSIPLYLFSMLISCCFPWCVRAPLSSRVSKWKHPNSSRNMENFFGMHLLEVYISSLPKEMVQFFSKFLNGEEDWKQSDLCYFSQLKEGTRRWNDMLHLYNTLGGSPLPPQTATAVCNPSLISNFVNQKNILQTRFKHAPSIFNNQKWRKQTGKKIRIWVYSKYEDYVENYDWNINQNIPIVPVVHGTNLKVALQIANTGFTKLSHVDEGFYGRGIYFTNSVLYASPYFSNQEDPAMILGYLLPGNTYPIYEHPLSNESIRGTSLRTNSNVVVTDKTGLPSQDEANYFLEFVIEQESLVFPAYIIQPDVKQFKRVLGDYERKVQTNLPKDGKSSKPILLHTAIEELEFPLGTELMEPSGDQSTIRALLSEFSISLLPRNPPPSKKIQDVFQLPVWITYHTIITLLFVVSLASLISFAVQQPISTFWILTKNLFVTLHFRSKQLDLAYAKIPYNNSRNRLIFHANCDYDYGEGLDKFWFMDNVPTTSQFPCSDWRDLNFMVQIGNYYAIAVILVFISVIWSGFKVMPYGRAFELEYQIPSALLTFFLYGLTLTFSIFVLTLLKSMDGIVLHNLYQYVTNMGLGLFNYPNFPFNDPGEFYLSPDDHYFYRTVSTYPISLSIVCFMIGSFLESIGHLVSFLFWEKDVNNGEPKSCFCWLTASKFTKPRTLTISGIILVIGFTIVSGLSVFSFFLVRLITLNIVNLDYYNSDHLTNATLKYTFYTTHLAVDHISKNGEFANHVDCLYNQSYEYSFMSKNNTSPPCPPTHEFFDISRRMFVIQIITIGIGALNVIWHVTRMCWKNKLVLNNHYLTNYLTSFLCLSFVILCYICSNLNFISPSTEVLYPLLDCHVPTTKCGLTLLSDNPSQFYWILTGSLAIPLYIFSSSISCCFPWCLRAPSSASRNVEKIFGKQLLKVYFSSLPQEITECFPRFTIIKRNKWKQTDLCYFYDLQPDTKEWMIMEKLYHKLGGESLPPLAATVLCNPTLVSNFVNQKNILQTRFENSPKIFYKQKWRKNPDREHRLWVYSKFKEYINAFTWNKSLTVPIIPVVHGTDMKIALQIANTGFAKLSLLDEGFYGRGIYFTNSVPYASPYFSNQEEPAMILGYLLPGNTYPVYEHPFEKDSIRGTSLRTNSNVVVTDKAGLPTRDNYNIFFEFVIEQESLVLPLYIIQPDTQLSKTILDSYQRHIPTST